MADQSVQKTRLLYSLAALIATGIFVVDLLTPPSVAGGAFFIVAVWFSRYIPGERTTIVMALACSVLLLTGTFISPWQGEVLSIVVANQALGLFAIWVVAYFCLETKRVEADLRHSAERSESIVEAALDAVIAMDETGRVIEWNPQAEAIFGWSGAEAIGRPVAELIIPTEFRDAHRQGLQRFLATGEGPVLNRRLELTGLRRTGEEFPVELTVCPIRSGPGWNFSAFVRDISARKKAEETTNRLAAIVESSDDAIIGKTLDGTIRTWNRGAERIYGYTAEEAVGQHITFIAPEDRGDEITHILQQVGEGDTIEHFETVRRRKDGNLIDVALTISPIQLPGGEIVGASAIARDITQKKRMENALRFLAEASGVLTTLVDYNSTLQKVARLAIPKFADICAVDMLDAGGALQRVAAAAAETNEPISTRKLRIPEPARSSDIQAAYQQKRPLLILGDSIDKEPAPRFVEVRRHPLAKYGLGSGMCIPLVLRKQVQGVISFGTARGKRTYSEEDVRVAENLAHRAATAIENAQLYGRLSEADRRKDEFLAMLAHELRNPLAPIRSGLQLLEMEGVDEKTAIWARQTMTQQVEHMVRLIDDLLDVSRIVRGKIDLQLEEVELATVVQRAVDGMTPLMQEKEHDFRVELPEEPIWLKADPVRLSQVFSNLLSNAAKYTPSGGNVSLVARCLENEAVVRVRDNGMGISRDDQEAIFDLFAQSDRSMARSQGGLGIGLTLARSLVRMHGGQIAVESEGRGKGSEFTVRLPVLAETAGPKLDTTRDAPGAEESFSPQHIVVVEDNESAAMMLAQVLSRWGHEVRVAHNANNAWDLIEARRPEIMLVDVGLPDVSGFDLAARLRQLPDGERLLLVAITGYGQQKDRERSHEAGFDLHLVKPVSEKELRGIFQHAKLHPERSSTSDESRISPPTPSSR